MSPGVPGRQRENRKSVDHEVDELKSVQLNFIIACRFVPRVLPGYPGEWPTEVKRRFVDVRIGSSESKAHFCPTFLDHWKRLSNIFLLIEISIVRAGVTIAIWVFSAISRRQVLIFVC